MYEGNQRDSDRSGTFRHNLSSSIASPVAAVCTLVCRVERERESPFLLTFFFKEEKKRLDVAFNQFSASDWLLLLLLLLLLPLWPSS